MKFKKKSAVYSVIALMLCVAVYLNWSYNRGREEDESLVFSGDELLSDASGENDAQTVTPVSGEEDYFSAARLSRQKARDEAVTILNNTVENEQATEEARKEAMDSISAMAACAVSEARIENLVVAKGYSECVVFINDNGVNVIIRETGAGVSDADVARIKEIVIEETSVTSDKVKIIETK